jgi:hypothetical protein
MALFNSIRRRSEQDMTFTEFDYHPNFVSYDIFSDVVPRSQTIWRKQAFTDGLCS